ncbi:GntR family transcriptional regulator [Tuberibacillus calidus]|jgi:GntR family transcriptional regulator|uniref:GntR family transcriptional regulator n=1 Tax=Tuberibacillus calidus TaxID=340097 RepID=UPI0003F70F68|nr:GntR family transcriptional regulator [Tuberibacillus calidus]
MFDLDWRSRKPIYEQLVEKIKTLIINDVWKKDEQLPSVRALAEQLTINPNTIQKAYRELETQGYIYSIKGKGSYVNSVPDIEKAEKRRKIKSELTRLMAEGLYLGLTFNELYQLLKELDQKINGGEHDD